MYQKAGSLSISGGTLNATGDAAAYAYNGNGANSTGDALVVDTCGYPGGAPTTSVTGGTFTSDNASAVGSYAYGDGNTAETGFVTGGTFDTDVSAFVPEGYTYDPQAGTVSEAQLEVAAPAAVTYNGADQTPQLSVT